MRIPFQTASFSDGIRKILMTQREQILEQQRQMHLLFAAWMADKKQHEILTYCKPNGDLVRHHPDGKEEVLKHAE